MVSMEYVVAFMIVLILKLMPQIKPCVLYKHGAITIDLFKASRTIGVKLYI